ncbi:MAG: tetratricopeptide repeat protein [Planctomycetes bacterium]|nr:tetratricopeptide repeat protein [Planctomycetota bacterium]
MLSSEEDPVRARIIESELALEAVAGFLELDAGNLLAGVRSQAEAFIANSPSLWGYERDTERLFMTLDIAVSAIQADPTFGGGYALAANCIYRLGTRDVDIFDSRALVAALPWANRAIMADPDNPEGWEVYLQLHCYKGDFKTAEQILGRIYQRFGDSDLYARCAFLFFRLQGDVAQAINYGALAWQTEWDNSRLLHTLFALGQLYRDTQQWQKAADCYRVITEKDHENAWAYHYMARCAQAAGDPQAAADLNRRAIELGNLHEFREFQEELRRASGRFRMGAGRITNVPPTRTGNTSRLTRPGGAPPDKTASGRVMPAPPPVGGGKLMPTPPPVRVPTPVKPPPRVPTPVKPPPAITKAPPAVKGPLPPRMTPPPARPAPAPPRMTPPPPPRRDPPK